MDREEAMSDEELDELEALLSEIEACLVEGDIEGARAALEAAEEMAGSDDPDVGYGRALIFMETGDVNLAVAELKQVLAGDAEFADAHHLLGLALEELGDETGMTRHFLETQALDEKADRERGPVSAEDLALIERVARETLEALPEEFSERLADVPVILEGRPDRSLVAEGFDPRALGLFDGPEHGRSDVPAPTRVVLFAHNLLDNFSGEDLEEQVEITVLHEVGHYFGLDEDDMTRLGLD